MSEVLDQSEIDALLAEAGGFAESATDLADDSGHAASAARGGGASGVDGALSADVQHELQRILEIEVPVIVRLASRIMPLSQVLRMSTGSILEFAKSADDDLELLVGRKRIGTGQAVKMGENFGLRISRIAPMRDKIQALGPASS